jgi:hypothetical protein
MVVLKAGKEHKIKSVWNNLMNVIATDSMERLRARCKVQPDTILQSFEDLSDEIGLSTVEVDINLGDLTELYLPEGQSQETNKDLENCKLIAEVFKNLTPAQATDERLWVTLCFDHFNEYARHRWPLEKAKTPENHVADHWFAKTSRNRMRDNAISRLWWMAHIANRVPDVSVDEVLKTLFFNSDYRSNLLERNSSANAINVVVGVLQISQKAFDDGVDFNREKFRTFMKSVDQIGKRTALASLAVDDVVQLLKPAYDEAYQVKSKSRGIRGLFGR